MSDKGAAPTSHDEAAAQLCTACGLCCTGFFSSYGVLQSEDNTAVLARLLPLAERNGKLSFTLRCPALQGRCCSIYKERPATCRSYRCALLKKVDAELAEFPAARDIVVSTVAAFDLLARELSSAGFLVPGTTPSAAIKAFRAAYIQAAGEGQTDFFERHRDLILSWKKASWAAQTHFDARAGERLALPTLPPRVRKSAE